MMRRNPYAKVTFYGANLGTREATASGQASDSLLAITTRKDLRGVAGSWEVHLTAKPDGQGRTWMNRVDAQDTVEIQIGTGPDRLETVMIGLIDETGRSTVVGPRSAQQTVRVAGRDFGKILLDQQVTWKPYQANLARAAVRWALAIAAGDLSGPCAAVIQNIMQRLLVGKDQSDPIVQQKVHYQGSHTHASAFLNQYLGETLGSHVSPAAVSTFEGAIWNVLAMFANRPWNELWIDTRPDPEAVVLDAIVVQQSSLASHATVPHVFLRQTPFVSRHGGDRWRKLRTHGVRSREISQQSLSRTAAEVYNYVWLHPVYLVAADDLVRLAILKPWANQPSIAKFGFRPYPPIHTTIVSWEFKGAGKGKQFHYTDQPLLEQLQQMLGDWMVQNHLFESGHLTVAGRPSYRIGDKLHWLNTDKEFYIEGVTQSFRNFQGYTTSLRLTRGRGRMDERFTASHFEAEAKREAEVE